MNQTLVEKINQSVDKRILVMTGAFPFFVVGTVLKVEPDTVHVMSEFGIPAPLKNQEFAIQLEHIAAFYAEENAGDIPVVW